MVNMLMGAFFSFAAELRRQYLRSYNISGRGKPKARLWLLADLPPDSEWGLLGIRRGFKGKFDERLFFNPKRTFEQWPLPPDLAF